MIYRLVSFWRPHFSLHWDRKTCTY